MAAPTKNPYFEEGLRLLRSGDWVESIRTLGWAKDAEPDNPAIFLALIEAYETAADSEQEPDLLQQAFNVCRDLRDRRLPSSDRQQADFFHVFVRIRDKLMAARASGWTPPPPKERIGEAQR
ncbi:MAG TPA: hypothetical protein VFB95_14685 [Candidatus Cryosericum sp.]|nr:hypothetical protein [Candidatus Cryosericum sp.]